MTLQASGTIHISDINVEMGYASNRNTNLNELEIRRLAGVLSGHISMSNFHGKAARIDFSVNSTQYIAGPATFVAQAGIQAGDVLLLVCIAWNVISGTVPTGFTQFDQQQNTLSALGTIRSAYKVAVGNESGTTISGYLQGTGGDAAYFLVLRPTRTGGTISTMTTTWQRTDGDPADVNLVYPSGNVGALVFAVIRDATSAHSSIWSQTPAQDGQVATGATRLYYRVKQYGDSGGKLVMNDMGADNILYTASISLT